MEIIEEKNYIDKSLLLVRCVSTRPADHIIRLRKLLDFSSRYLGKSKTPPNTSSDAEQNLCTSPRRQRWEPSLGRALIHTAQHKVAQVLRSASSHLFFTLGKYFKER